MARVPSGAARRVQRAPDGQRVEKAPDDRLLDADQRVAGAVVRLRPPSVAGAHVHLGDIRSKTERRFLIRSHDASHLVDARACGLVVAFEKVAEQRQPLDADEELPKPYVSRHGPTVSGV